MIVEFTGCSGAGKTTLLRQVRSTLDDAACASVEPYDQFCQFAPRSFTRLLRARCATSTSLANLTVELLGSPWTFTARRRFADCDRWVRARIRAASLNRWEWIRLSRSWNRKLAVVARHAATPCGGRSSISAQQCMLHDEGTVHFATTILARLSGRLDHLLDQYLELIPLPERVVWVTASADRAAERLAHRSYIPVPDRHGADRERVMQRACEVAYTLVEHPLIRPRLIQADNDSENTTDLRNVAHSTIRQLWPEVRINPRQQPVVRRQPELTTESGSQVP